MKVLVSLSGGKESLVTAWLLKKQGMQVKGIYFDLEGLPSVSEKIGLLERKLGISIQVIPVREEFLSEYSDASQSYLELGQLLDAKSFFHRNVLFKKLFELKEQMHFDQVATGHRVLLQEDQVLKATRVLQGADGGKSDADLLLGRTPAELQTLITPLGSIPVSMLDKLIAELNPSEEMLSLDFNWERLGLGSLTTGFSVMDLKYSRKIGEVLPGQKLEPGSRYDIPDHPDLVFKVVDFSFGNRQVFVLASKYLEASEIVFEEVSWFTLNDLKLKSLECGLLDSETGKTTRLKLIQFEGKRVKGFLNEALAGQDVNIFKGQTVLWVEGSEVLGGGRVLGIK